MLNDDQRRWLAHLFLGPDLRLEKAVTRVLASPVHPSQECNLVDVAAMAELRAAWADVAEEAQDAAPSSGDGPPTTLEYVSALHDALTLVGENSPIMTAGWRRLLWRQMESTVLGARSDHADNPAAAQGGGMEDVVDAPTETGWWWCRQSWESGWYPRHVIMQIDHSLAVEDTRREYGANVPWLRPVTEFVGAVWAKPLDPDAVSRLVKQLAAAESSVGTAIIERDKATAKAEGWRQVARQQGEDATRAERRVAELERAVGAARPDALEKTASEVAARGPAKLTIEQGCIRCGLVAAVEVDEAARTGRVVDGEPPHEAPAGWHVEVVRVRRELTVTVWCPECHSGRVSSGGAGGES